MESDKCIGGDDNNERMTRSAQRLREGYTEGSFLHLAALRPDSRTSRQRRECLGVCVCLAAGAGASRKVPAVDGARPVVATCWARYSRSSTASGGQGAR